MQKIALAAAILVAGISTASAQSVDIHTDGNNNTYNIYMNSEPAPQYDDSGWYSEVEPVPFGQWCYINDFTIVGPGQPLPVGSSCWIQTYHGPVGGYIIQ